MPNLFRTGKPNSSLAGGLVRKRDLKSINDKTLREFFKKVERYQKGIANVDPDMRSALGLPTNRVRNFLAKCLYRITPQRFYGMLSGSMFELMGEEKDILVWHGNKLRERVNDTQEAVRNISSVSKVVKEEADELKIDIEMAISENWNAQKLQEYIDEAVDIETFPEVAQLLDDQFWGLTPDKQEKRKERMLRMLERIEASQRQAAAYLGEDVCEEALLVLNLVKEEYYCYMKIVVPVAAVRDTAKSLIGTHTAMFTAKDSIKETMRIAGEVLEIVADGIKIARDGYSLSGPDMIKAADAERQRIKLKLKELEKSAVNTFQKAIPQNTEVIEIKATSV